MLSDLGVGVPAEVRKQNRLSLWIREALQGTTNPDAVSSHQCGVGTIGALVSDELADIQVNDSFRCRPFMPQSINRPVADDGK